jgi:hypothetical protein
VKFYLAIAILVFKVRDEAAPGPNARCVSAVSVDRRSAAGAFGDESAFTLKTVIANKT